MSTSVQTDGKASHPMADSTKASRRSRPMRQPAGSAKAVAASRSSASIRNNDSANIRPFVPLYWLGLLGTLTAAALAFPVSAGEVWFNPVAMVIAALILHGSVLVLYTNPVTARLGAALSAAVFLGFLGWATSETGGFNSPLAIFFVLAPMEAMLTRNTRVAAWLAGWAVVSFTLSVLAAMRWHGEGIVSEGAMFTLMALGMLYALSLAARVVKISSLRDLRARASQRAIDQFHAVTHDVFLILRRDGSAERIFGAVGSVLVCDRCDLVDEGFLERMHIADRPSFLTTLDQVHAKRSRDTADVRLRVGPTKGPQRFIWSEIDLSSITGLNGETEIYALVRDISAAKEHEAELMLAREKAEASDAAKGRFLATMSHELRTPLNAIIGFADILDEEVFGALANDQQREYLGLIRESGGHLLQLVNDLLDMSKLEAGHFQIVAEPFILLPVVQRCARLMGAQVEKGKLKLVVDVPETMPELVADQRAVRQVLINLLSNACKFTGAEGTVTVRARKDGPTLVMSVIDSGIGISPDDMKNLGQPFFQANGSYDRNHQGTGLGLSVVKGLCELHDGTWSVTSVEGEGTTVTVRLPFAGPADQRLDDDGVAKNLVADNTVVLAKLQGTRTVSTQISAPPMPVAEPLTSTADSAASAQAEPAADVFAAEPSDDELENERQRAHG